MATPVFPSMVASPNDGWQPLLVKICYYLELAAEAGGATDATMPYATMVPAAQDPIQVLLVKIAYWASQITGGGGGVGLTNPVYTGAAPPAAPAYPLQGALFTPDADGDPLQKWIPGTGWVVI